MSVHLVVIGNRVFRLAQDEPGDAFIEQSAGKSQNITEAFDRLLNVHQLLFAPTNEMKGETLMAQVEKRVDELSGTQKQQTLDALGRILKAVEHAYDEYDRLRGWYED